MYIYIDLDFIYKVGKLNKTSKPSLDSDSSSPDGLPGKLLGGYLAGLIEGDGSIIVPKTIRNQKGNWGGGFASLPSPPPGEGRDWCFISGQYFW